MDIKTRLKNPLFIISVIALLFSSAKIDVNTLTSWSLVLDAFKSIFSNPASIISFVVALIGQLNNPLTPGLKD